MEYVLVDEEWLRRAKEYGTIRNELNGGNDTAAYAHNGVLPYSSLTASRLAVVAEVGAHLYFGVDPESTTYVVGRSEANYARLRARADLEVAGRHVEVRNATHPTSPIPIKAKDVALDALVVQTFVEMADKRPTGRVWLLGWADARADYDRAMRKSAGTAYKHIKREMTDLKEMLCTTI